MKAININQYLLIIFSFLITSNTAFAGSERQLRLSSLINAEGDTEWFYMDTLDNKKIGKSKPTRRKALKRKHQYSAARKLCEKYDERHDTRTRKLIENQYINVTCKEKVSLMIVGNRNVKDYGAEISHYVNVANLHLKKNKLAYFFEIDHIESRDIPVNPLPTNPYGLNTDDMDVMNSMMFCLANPNHSFDTEDPSTYPLASLVEVFDETSCDTIRQDYLPFYQGALDGFANLMSEKKPDITIYFMDNLGRSELQSCGIAHTIGGDSILLGKSNGDLDASQWSRQSFASAMINSSSTPAKCDSVTLVHEIGHLLGLGHGARTQQIALQWSGYTPEYTIDHNERTIKDQFFPGIKQFYFGEIFDTAVHSTSEFFGTGTAINAQGFWIPDELNTVMSYGKTESVGDDSIFSMTFSDATRRCKTNRGKKTCGRDEEPYTYFGGIGLYYPNTDYLHLYQPIDGIMDEIDSINNNARVANSLLFLEQSEAEESAISGSRTAPLKPCLPPDPLDPQVRQYIYDPDIINKRANSIAIQFAFQESCDFFIVPEIPTLTQLDFTSVDILHGVAYSNKPDEGRFHYTFKTLSSSNEPIVAATAKHIETPRDIIHGASAKHVLEKTLKTATTYSEYW